MAQGADQRQKSKNNRGDIAPNVIERVTLLTYVPFFLSFAQNALKLPDI